MVNISRSSRQDNPLKKKKSLIDTNAAVVHYIDIGAMLRKKTRAKSRQVF
jgi:hypothetical protein